jgi:hypothetical protein
LLFLVATSAPIASCGGDDFCSPGSYECSGTTPAAGTSSSGSGGTAGGESALGGTTGHGGFGNGGSGGGLPSLGGSAGTEDTNQGGQAGSANGGESALGGTTGASGAGESGQGGEGPTAPPVCDLTALKPGCVLPAGQLGIYVAPPDAGGSDMNTGGSDAPVATLAQALALAVGDALPIFVCAGTYKEHVEVTTSDVAFHGSFTCGSWTWTYDPTADSRVAPTTRNEALRVTNVHGFEMTDMDLVAANGAGPGASSVAVFVSGSDDVTFTRVRVVAGNGNKGADGAPPQSNSTSLDLSGNPGKLTAGGEHKDCQCPDGTVTTGAVGGNAITPTGGGNGMPDLGGGLGGVVGSCGGDPGGTGHDGAAGMSAADAVGAAVAGTLDENGWKPAPGVNASNGGQGQGGGGGAGAITGGGGGGACGGCGGGGGGGGSGGGASIGILAYGSSITLNACLITTGNAGKGGNGVAGQAGQGGGSHANGYGDACPGGAGGKGGQGGVGGGGAGGISVGVVWSNMSTVNIVGETMIMPGLPGSGGLGSATDKNGLDGVAEETLWLQDS